MVAARLSQALLRMMISAAGLEDILVAACCGVEMRVFGTGRNLRWSAGSESSPLHDNAFQVRAPSEYLPAARALPVYNEWLWTVAQWLPQTVARFGCHGKAFLNPVERPKSVNLMLI